MKAKFICQFDWATGHPDYTLFLRIFLHETGVLTGRLSKVDGSPEGGQASPSLLRANDNKTVEQRIHYFSCLPAGAET